ncbi:MAG TPA: substrate-binding domain-containing protein [Gaiellaceae bacterium]|jgi:ribose transport system substrate-binding protein|nr:substrate-binding domain-containing protein [Gaiellaceae bacterium]
MRTTRLTRRVAIALAAVVAVAAVLTATSLARSSSHQAKTVHLAFIYPGAFANFAQEMALGAKAAAQHTPGVKITDVGPPSNDGNAQVQLFQDATRTSTDGIAWMTLFPQLFIRPVQQVEKSIPLVAVDVPPPAGTTVTTFVGNSNTELGQALAAQLFKQSGFSCSSGGQILVGTDTPGLPPLVARNNGFSAAVKAKCPKVTFYNFDSKQTATDNYNAWNAAVKSHPNALAFVGPGSEDAVSLAQIERLTGKHLLAGADDLDPVALQGVKNGYIFALISPEHWLKGYIAIKLLAKHAQTGAALPKGWWNPGYLVVNSKNIAKILARQKTAASQYAYFAPIAAKELANPAKYIKPFSKIN